MFNRLGLRLAAATSVAVFAGSGGSALAAGPTYATINYPGAAVTLATDINDSGQIVGEYSFDGLNDRQGFLLSNGHFSSISFPGAYFTRAIGINGSGEIVGDYVVNGSGSSNEHGFLLKGGVFSSIEVPGASQTIAAGINKNGDIAGWYFDSKGTHGFLLRADVFSSIDFPGADAFTRAYAITDAGAIAGEYEGASGGKYHVFTLTNGVFNSIPDYPGSVQTAPKGFGEKGGLNGAGDISNSYCSSTPCSTGTGQLHGFLLSGGIYAAIDFPGSVGTIAFGLNSSDDLVGGYQDSAGIHGYLRTP